MHEVANPAYIEGFPFSDLPRVAPYCAPGGIRVVSEGRGLYVAGTFALDRRVGTGWPTRNRSSSRSTTHTMRWALVSRCHARPGPPGSPKVWLGLTDERPRLKVHGLAYLLEEPLVQASVSGSSASYLDPHRRSCLRRGTAPGPLLAWWRFFPRARRCCVPSPLGPLLPRWRLFPRWRLPTRRGSDEGRYAFLRRNGRGVGYGPAFHIPRHVPQRGPRHVRRAPTRGSVRSGAGAELRRGLEDTKQPFRPLCDLRLYDLRLPEEGRKPLVACGLGVEGVTLARIGTIQGVVEDADEVVVLIPGARGLLPVIHHELLP